MTGYLSSWNDGVAKPGILEFVRPAAGAHRGSCRRLIGLRRLTTTGRCAVRAGVPAGRFPGQALGREDEGRLQGGV